MNESVDSAFSFITFLNKCLLLTHCTAGFGIDFQLKFDHFAYDDDDNGNGDDGGESLFFLSVVAKTPNNVHK